MTRFLGVLKTAEANWTSMLRTSINRTQNDQTPTKTLTEAKRLMSTSLDIFLAMNRLNELLWSTEELKIEEE